MRSDYVDPDPGDVSDFKEFERVSELLPPTHYVVSLTHYEVSRICAWFDAMSDSGYAERVDEIIANRLYGVRDGS